MTFPKSVRIRGREWAIRRRRRKSLGDALGLCHYDIGALDVAFGQDEFNTKDTVLHEALHALLAEAPFERPTDEEERYVLFLSTALLGLLRDNPEFAQWLTSRPTK